MKNINTVNLRNAAIDAALKSHSPYSHAKVGCALLTQSDEIFLGANIENASYGATVCAERVAICNAIMQGHQTGFIKAIYVYTQDGWPPCGMCRQVIAEFAANDTQIIIGDRSATQNTISFSELYPFEFSSKDLVKK